MRAISAICARISRAPSAQFSPIDNGAAWRTEFQNAAGVWPESKRPERSVMVPEIITGTRIPVSSVTSAIAAIAALALSVSKIVSISRRSAPPSSSPLTCSAYALRSSSKVTARKPGLATSGEIEAVRLVGPMAPATKRGRPSSLCATSAAARASLAPSRLSSYAIPAMP